MMPIPREYVQTVSTFMLILGVAMMFANVHFHLGLAFVGMACWVLLMSESILMSRVQNEMTQTLESLRKKQSSEIEELLYFLRSSKLGNSPWSCLDAAKSHIKKIGYPAIITDAGGACVAVNPPLYDALGYGKDTIGQLCHSWQHTESYGEYVQGIAVNITEGKRFMHSRLIMVDAEGNYHLGTVAIIMLPDLRTAVGLWYPDSDGILKDLRLT